jgi:hypothetical protein
MFVGGAGVGKTQLVKGKLATLPEHVLSLNISFNYFTDVISFQKASVALWGYICWVCVHKHWVMPRLTANALVPHISAMVFVLHVKEVIELGASTVYRTTTDTRCGSFRRTVTTSEFCIGLRKPQGMAL